MKKLYLFFIISSTFIFFSLNANTVKKSSIDIDKHESEFGALEYRLIGPFRGGRSAAVTGVPNKPNLYYFGATGGGVWKTQDGGNKWENITDGFFGGSIGSVSVAKSDPNVIYVGGGEKTVRGNVSSGYGVWKSLDAGKTWKFSGLKNSRHIPRISIDPNNHDIVYAGVLGNIYKPSDERGLYKSVDGGKNWNKILYANEDSGVVDLIIDPTNSRIIYASTWNVRRTPYSLSSGGEGSALWKSEDSGNTWKEISLNKGFPDSTLGIIGVTVSPVNNEKVWAIVENKDKGGLYLSNDGGQSWKLINNERKLRQRAWYYTRVYADTQDENLVYVLNVRYHKSTDSGKSFKTYNAPHGDHHDLWISPEDPKRMIIGDDGGAQVSYDRGESWSTYMNQPTSQFYRVTTDNSFPFRIYAAQQDNSTIRINHRSSNGLITESDWEPTAGGESAHIAVDPLNNEVIYGGSYDGFLTRVNHESGSVRAINVWPDNPMGHGAEGMKYRFQWNFPIIFSKHNPKKLYTFSNQVHVTENEGQSWDIISPDLTRNDPNKLKSSGGPITQDNTSVEYYCTIFAAQESPLKEGLIWVGSDDGLVHLTKNAGKTWDNITPKKMPEWMMINSIEPSAFDEGTCYIAGTKYKTGDFKPYIYKTTDFGKTWKKITNGINEEHFTRVVREDPENKNILYSGTETGMYISLDAGQNWKSFQLNLPIVPITDLTIKNNSLVVATQGRSIWILDDLTVIHQSHINSLDRKSLPYHDSHNIELFTPKSSYRMSGRSSSRKSLTAGQNLENGVITYFNLFNYSEQDNVSLTYLNNNKDTIISLNNKASGEKKLKIKKGPNKFTWDMYYDGASDFDGMVLWWASLNGPKAVPGDYFVELNVNGVVQQKPFKINIDPRSESSIKSMQEQFDFINSINKTMDKAHKSIKTIRSIKSQLLKFTSTYNQDDLSMLKEKATALSDDLSKIEKALYQTQNRSGQDPLNFPIRLTNKLGHLNSLVSMGDFSPTEQDIAVKEYLTDQINTNLEIFDKLMIEEVKIFNELFNNNKLNYLISIE
ncbi:glycosyl hydrolase [Flavobacteriaceae bacterium]|nr:glycosyl hydrolase [Flavobacteriaceae bacterium]